MNPRLVAIAQLQALMIGSALVFVLAKRALLDVPPFTFAWLQIASGGLLLTLFTLGRGERLPRGLGWKAWAALAFIGVCNFCIVRVCFMLGLERIPATTHAYLVSFTPLATMFVSTLLLGERPSLLQGVGALLALAGVRVFFREIPAADEVQGVVFVAIVVLGLAATNNVTRRLAMAVGDRLPNNTLSTVAIWIGGLPVVLAGVAFDWPPPVGSWQSWGIIVLNGAVSIAIGLTLFNYVLRTLRSYEASILTFSGLIWTALFAIPIVGERLAGHEWLGIAMMLAGVAMAQWRPAELRA